MEWRGISRFLKVEEGWRKYSRSPEGHWAKESESICSIIVKGGLFIVRTSVSMRKVDKRIQNRAEPH